MRLIQHAGYSGGTQQNSKRQIVRSNIPHLPPPVGFSLCPNNEQPEFTKYYNAMNDKEKQQEQVKKKELKKESIAKILRLLRHRIQGQKILYQCDCGQLSSSPQAAFHMHVKWTKNTNIKWLQEVRGMRRHTQTDDCILLAEGIKFCI